MICAADRRYFDKLLDQAIAALPEPLLELIEEVPVVVEDEPDPALLAELGLAPELGPGPEEEADLCGLHTGIPLTERSVLDGPDLPGQVALFRGPIWRLAAEEAGENEGPRFEKELERQIWITLLHELGHHYGLDEDDLDALGYG